jgi:Protein of unknown function (DUF2384)
MDAALAALATHKPGGVTPVPSGREHSAMLAAFRSSGGIARGDDLGRLLDYLDRDDFVSLARLIASGSVFGFAWRESFWIPMFQFELRDLSLKPNGQAVLAELGGTYNGWSLASWFAEPNDWLYGRRPVDLLNTDLPAVLGAARADRYIVEA